jgi:exodeoxyribonuclease V beta subunit
MNRAGHCTELALGEGGRSLIEASAGTGKTWTISVLYLRLLLEQSRSPAQIIVTTFTDAAAQELRERIRDRIGWALRETDASGAPTTADDDAEAPVRNWLRARWPTVGAMRADRDRLLLAQIELDRAPIGTLHSLCRRILTDYPFESSSAFEFGEPVTPDAIQQELIDDLWRQLNQGEGELDEGDEIWRRVGRSKLDKHLRAVLAPGVGVALLDRAELDAVMHDDNASMLLVWLDKAQFKMSTSKLRTRLIRLAQVIADGDPLAALDADITAVLDDAPATYLKPPWIDHPETARVLAFARHAADVLSRLADQPRAIALARYGEELRRRGRERLAASGRMTFDELIERVHHGLHGDSGDALAERLFAAWPVAMVDEFQDTDLEQFAILDRIYRDSPSRPSMASGALGLLPGAVRGRLVMIGDPKQAIYRFRGGDIDAYLQVRTSAESLLDLTTNFRSARPLVQALNAFYEASGAALSADSEHTIRYVPVGAGGKCDATPYRVDGATCEQPLQFHYWDGSSVPDGADERVSAALEACARQVVELLSGRHTIGKHAVQPGNIAVLLPTRAQVLLLRDELRARGVPCVSTAWSSVFDSPWARELRIVLHAALHPRDEGAVRAALATRLGGRTFHELRDQRGDADAWERDAAMFDAWERCWRRCGVLALVQDVSAAAAPRLFAGDGGERALTDLRHLGELLQARSEQIAGREELLTWFADECERTIPEASEAAADERQQRIETDAARVRLMTLHGAKGLEFDIVVLPLLWTNRHNSKDEIVIIHDATAQQRCVTFGPAAQQRFRREGQDERFRLLYVALTRARHACHVYALSPERSSGNSKKPDADPDRSPLDAVLARLLGGAAAPTDIAHVRWSHGRWSWPDARYSPAQSDVAGSVRVLAPPPGVPFEATWSFSALASGDDAAVVEESAAADEAVASGSGSDAEVAEEAAGEVDAEHAGLAWLAPIAGADFGNAVHAILERRVVGQPMAAQHELIERRLREYGVALRGIALADLVPHLAARVQATLDTRLLPGAGAPTLAALPEHALCTEMPFDFALGTVSLQRLREACPFVPPGAPHTLRGMMTGQIDLVFEHGGRFHVLDYKSNRLGDGVRLSNYDGAMLARAMAHDHYRFQALLYTIALDRYLRQRIDGYRRDRHLGEAIYLFVRAVGIAPGTAPRAGIWSERFDDVLIAAVDAAFAAVDEAAA